MLIGNEAYDDEQAHGCLSDVNRMLNLLQTANEAGTRYQMPTTRTNLKASELRELMTELPGWGIDGDDITLVYYAGYGMLIDGTIASITGKDGEAYRLSELRESLDQLPGAKIIVLDCRYKSSIVLNGEPAELMRKYNSAVVSTFSEGVTGDDYYVLTSMTLDTTLAGMVQELGLPCGALTYYFAEGCGYDYKSQSPNEPLSADSNGNGAVSLIEAYDYITSSIDALAANSGIEPASNTLYSAVDGNFPLFSKRATAETLSVAIEPKTLSMAAGTTQILTASVLPVNAVQRDLYWLSSDLGICTVSQSGMVTAIRPGSATVSCISSNGMSAKTTIMVRDVTFVESVSLDPSKLVVAPGITHQLNLKMVPATSNELITWKSSEQTIATVSDEGLVTTIRNGSTVITAVTESGKEVSCVVQVVDLSNVVTELTLETNEINLYEGEARLLTHKVKPTKALDQMVTWSSSDDTVAQVETNGLIAGMGAGDAVITCTASSGVKSEVTVHVKGTLIQFTDKNITMKKGKTAKIRYKVQPSGAQTTISWESSSPDVATVSDNGTVTTIADGQTNIVATLANGQTATCKLSVASVPAKTIRFKKAKLSMAAGSTATLQYQITPKSASIKAVTWSSSNEEVVTVDEDGLITAVGVGKADVVGRTHNGKAAKCRITVKTQKASAVTMSVTEQTLRLHGEKDFQLSAIMEPENELGNRALKWESSNKKVVTVDQDGLVTAVGNGTASVRASSGKVSAECKFTVTSNRTYNKKPIVGEEKQLYTSVRRIEYEGEELVVQVHYANRTKESVTVPFAGLLKLNLSDGQSFELGEINTAKNQTLKQGKNVYFTFKYKLADFPQLQGLDLVGADIEILEPTTDGTTQDLTTTGEVGEL